MKLNSVFKLLSIGLALLLSLSAVYYLCDGFALSDWLGLIEDKHTYKTYSVPLSLKDVDTLQIENSNTDVYLKRAQNPEGKIKFKTGVDKASSFSFTKTNHVFAVKVLGQKGYSHTSLSIAVPANIKVITVKSVQGDVTANEIKLNLIQLSTITGDLTLAKVDANEAMLTTTSGDIDASGDLKKLRASSTSGDVDIVTENLTPLFYLNTISGDANVTIPASVTPNIDLQTVSGDRSMRDFIANPAKDTLIEIKTVSGDIEIE